jgi:hypothetical protein
MSAAAVTILTNNLEDAARRAGYIEGSWSRFKYGTKAWQERERTHGVLRSYSIRLVGVLRDIALGIKGADEALDEDYAYREQMEVTA